MVKKPVILLHGTRADGRVWREQELSLTKENHPWISLDLPGHGMNSGERFSLKRSFELIDQALDQLDATSATLVGASLGGYVSVAYAANHPQSVDGVLASGCATETARWEAKVYKTLTKFISTQWKNFKDASPMLIPQERSLNEDKLPWSVVTDMLSELSNVSYLDNLSRLSAPLWLVNGQWCPLRFGERSALRRLTPARRIVVPRVGHDVHLQAPRTFNGIMLRMLEAISTS